MAQSKVKIAWTAGMTAEVKEEFENLLRSSAKLSQRLRDLIRKRRQELDHLELSDDTYNFDPIKLAFINGRKRELRDLEALFDFLPKP